MTTDNIVMFPGAKATTNTSEPSNEMTMYNENGTLNKTFTDDLRTSLNAAFDEGLKSFVGLARNTEGEVVLWIISDDVDTVVADLEKVKFNTQINQTFKMLGLGDIGIGNEYDD